MIDINTQCEVWVSDFEYSQKSNELPHVLCMVARELRSGKTVKLWLGDNPPARPPFDVSQCIYVAYNAIAECLCHLVLGWPLPSNVIDLYAEFRNLVANRRKELNVDRLSLLDALSFYDLPRLSRGSKEYWRDIAVRQGPHSEEEKTGLLDYCKADVDGTAALYERMLPFLDGPRTLLRGRYSASAACIQRNGIPVDGLEIDRIEQKRDSIRLELIRDIDGQFDCYKAGKFQEAKFHAFVKSRSMHWPRLNSGRLRLDKGTFSDMAKWHPELTPLHELRKTLAELTKQPLAVAPNSRCHVSPGLFGTLTGRNSPRASEFIFSRAKWWRHLILARPGYVLIYLDWRSQEFAIAAALSGDEAMMEAYRTGDAYLGFGKACKVIPENATPDSHPELRKTFKVATLALQFGIGAERLGMDLGGGPIAGRRMLDRYQEAFPVFTRWSESQANKALLNGTLVTPFGWQIEADALDVKPRTYRNFPIQATGADMMRIAIILMIQRGVNVCAMVHDGFLIEAPIADVDRQLVTADKSMREASRLALYGFEVDVDQEIHADRFRDPSGADMWETICRTADICDSASPSNLTSLPFQSEHPVPSL